mgnify:CR=1 FL=1
MHRFWKGLAIVAACGIATAGCQELTVPNLNNPERERVLQEPDDVEALLVGTWTQVWDLWQGATYSSLALSAIADEFTTTHENYGAWTLSSEPRIAFDNSPEYAYAAVAENPYYNTYDALASVHDGLEAILKRGIRITDSRGTDLTPRAIAFAKFTQGALLGYLGLLYDRAFVVTENTPIADADKVKAMKPLPYKEVLDSAIASLEAALEIAATHGVAIPGAWVKGDDLSADAFQRLIHSYIARYLVYGARTPTERAAVDWVRVVQEVDQGIVSDFAINGGQGLNSSYKQYAQNSNCASCVTYYADYDLIGPADVSGAYQAWLATSLMARERFDIVTPDRRITGADGPRSNGTYFRYLSSTNLRADRGTYHFSNYQFYRFRGEYGRNAGTKLPAVTVAEMRLLKAEALYRLGDREGAAALINETRVANGELPPVTASGVPAAPDCVPRTADGRCGDLWDALVYEKRIETAGTDQIAFFDARGFGILKPGTLLHLPIPGRELDVYGFPYYTFGGGGEGSAN